MSFVDKNFDLYESVFDRLKDEWTFNCLTEPLVANNEAVVFLSTTERKYLIRLRKGKYYILSFEKVDKVMELDWNEKGKYKNAEELYNGLNGFFVYLEDYDLSLKKRN